jgi:hypothetical protein
VSGFARGGSSLKSFVLPAGETVIIRANLAQLYDLTVPGKYNLKVATNPDFWPKEVGKVEIDPVEFKVLSASPTATTTAPAASSPDKEKKAA